MLGRIVASTIAALGLLGGAAFAQSTLQSQSPLPGEATTTDQTTHSIPHEIREKLKQEGFSDVKVVPGSYLVSAKDRNGDAVTMIIGPRSMTIFTTGKGAPEQAQAPELKE